MARREWLLRVLALAAGIRFELEEVDGRPVSILTSVSEDIMMTA
jgi:hypothetical protein